MPKDKSYLATALRNVSKRLQAMVAPYTPHRSTRKNVGGKTIWPGNKGKHGSSQLRNRSVKRGGGKSGKKSGMTLRASAPSWEPPFPKLKTPAGMKTIWSASKNYNPRSVHGSAALANPKVTKGGRRGTRRN